MGHLRAMRDLVFKPAHELGRMLKARKVSAKELLRACLDQYAKHNAAVNAVVVTDIDRAFKAAEAADRRLKRGAALSPFDGVPMTVKESFNWLGTPTTFGDPALANNIAKDDADVVRRLVGAGAVLYGKTNVPLDLADWQSFNAVYGTTNNPWDLARAPGGSSGGAAAALATGMSAIEVGSDIGASIRNPAHYCGVFGHKPSYQLVSYRGHARPGDVSVADITVAGPLARSAKDLSLLLGLLAGPSLPEGRGLKAALPKAEQKSLKDFRVAVKLNSRVAEVDAMVENKIKSLGEALAKKVKKISFDAVPAFSDEENYQIFITLLRATAAKRLSDKQYEDALAKSIALPDDDRSYVAMMTRAFALSHRDWLRVHERRNQMRLIWDQFFTDWDVLLCPAAATTAFLHDQVGERHERFITVNGKQVSTIDQRFWAGYSGGYYLPSTVAPLGLAADGLPVGVQIITREFDDLKAIRFAELLEKEFGGFMPPPGY